MKILKKKTLKSTNGITLIALVITIIVLLILAGISISMLSGDNSILQKATDAKIETEKGQEKEIIALAYNSALAKKVSNGDSTPVTAEVLNTELTNQGANADGNNPIIVTFTNSKRQYTINSSGTIEYAGIQSEEEQDYQWTIVADNDNDGVISLGDEVAPLIDSVKDEHFYVISNNGDNVRLITKLSVDYVTNSQSSSAPGVTYDMAYCDLDGVEHDWVMPTWAVKSVEYSSVEYSYDDEFGNPDSSTAYNVYYDGTETGKVHCTGTYTKNYGLRLKQAGLNLMDFNNNSGCSYIGLPRGVDIMNAYCSDIEGVPLALGKMIGNRVVWSDFFDYGAGDVPYVRSEKHSDGLYYATMESDVFFADDITFSPVIQVDIDLINTNN